MRFIQIPKKTKGEFRQICVPNAEEKHLFRTHLSALNKKASTLCDPDIVHGFMNHKSPVTNAERHIGYQYTLKFDLENFFDSVKPEHLKGILTQEELDTLMPSERAYQGLPTSPIIANLAAKKMDDAVSKMIKKKKLICVYTRYADDLCFSFNDYNNVSILKTNIAQIVGRCGFSINKKKTWLQDARYGLRRITGVSVSDSDVRASRSTRRRLRAAIHQKNINEAQGLKEWCKMKRPDPDKNVITQGDLNNLTKLWKIPRIRLNLVPKKEDDIIINTPSGNILITGDPIQLLGLSNFSTNWGSCMTHPSGCYHKYASFWLYLKGTRIAGLVSGDTKTFGAFTRPTFKARTLIHTFSDGTVAFDKVYGESYSARETLIVNLISQGYIDVATMPYKRTNPVLGVVPINLVKSAPYFDNLDYQLNTTHYLVHH